jgi:hypothetical protein
MTSLQENEIPLPWQADPPSEEEIPPGVDTAALTPLEQTNQVVMNDLNLNCLRAPCGHHSSFALVADVSSGACSRLMQQILFLPSERTLRNFAVRLIPVIEVVLSDPEGIPHIISEFIQCFPATLSPPVLCTLWIDAFSIDPTARCGRKSSSFDGCNNSFLFQWTLLNCCL